MNELESAADIKTALEAAGVWEVFVALPPPHVREYAKWINEAKKPETRQARIEKMCTMLQERKNPTI